MESISKKCFEKTKLNGINSWNIYQWMLLATFTVVVCSQFYFSHSFRDSIETSNYFALILSSMLFSFVSLPLLFTRKIKLGWGDFAIGGLFLYLIVNSYFYDSLDSVEFKMAVSYFAVYFCLKLAMHKYPEFTRWAMRVILLVGIYQALLVLLQLYGFDSSNHHRFAVTGSFFNPGPCGIFLAAVLVLAVAIIKNSIKKHSVDYITAYVAVFLILIAIFPTMSRAGWIAAFICIALMYRETILKYVKVKYLLVATIVLLVGIYWLKKDSADGRLFMWRNGISAFMEKPIVGVGIGNFGQSYSEAQSRYFLQNEVLINENVNIEVVGVPTSVFNEFISLGMMLGAIGLIFVGVILYYKFKTWNILSYMALSVLISSLFSYPFYIPVIALLLVFALANQVEARNYNVASYILFPFLLFPFLFNYNSKNEIKACKDWKDISFSYTMKEYEAACEEYGELLPYFKKNYKFLFEYGHSLNKVGHFEKSNEILLTGLKYSTDPMFLAVIGNNYLGLKEYDKSADAYLKSYYLCPNRLYPIYLLTKLYDTAGDRDKTKYYGNILLNKQIKIKSSATDEMKHEVEELLKTYNF